MSRWRSGSDRRTAEKVLCTPKRDDFRLGVNRVGANILNDGNSLKAEQGPSLEKLGRPRATSQRYWSTSVRRSS